MDKAEHGKRLRAAMARRDISNETLASLMNVGKKTIYNWRVGATMPNDVDRSKLRAHLGPYDAEGDPVEVAIASSGLADFRQSRVLSVYQELRREQRRDDDRAS